MKTLMERIKNLIKGMLPETKATTIVESLEIVETTSNGKRPNNFAGMHAAKPKIKGIKFRVAQNSSQITLTPDLVSALGLESGDSVAFARLPGVADVVLIAYVPDPKKVDSVKISKYVNKKSGTAQFAANSLAVMASMNFDRSQNVVKIYALDEVALPINYKNHIWYSLRHTEDKPIKAHGRDAQVTP